MKWAVAKWAAQVALSCLVSILVFMGFWFFVPRPVMWVFWVFLPIASTIGIVFGDLPLYKGKRPSVIAMSAACCLGLIGLAVGRSIGKVFWEGSFATAPGEAFLVLALVSLFGLIASSLIGYNMLSLIMRKLKSCISEQSEPTGVEIKKRIMRAIARCLTGLRPPIP